MDDYQPEKLGIYLILLIYIYPEEEKIMELCI